MSGRLMQRYVGLVILAFCLLALNGPLLAQDATPIAIGQNVPGEITAEASTARFAVSANAGETAVIQLLGFAPGFAPRFRVLNPADVEILVVANPNGLATISGSASFTDAGTYTIEVASEGNLPGQFLLSLSAGAPLPAPVELLIGQAVEAVVGDATPIQVYQFTALPAEPALLSIVGKLPDAGPVITLRDQTANRTIALHDGSVESVIYLLRANTQYQVEISARGAADLVPYSICLSVPSSAGACGTGSAPIATSLPTASPIPSASPSAGTNASTMGECIVTSATGGGVNVRSGPGTEFGIISSLSAGQSYPVMGQLAGGSWYQVSVNGQVGWVAAAVVQMQGACSALPVAVAPAAPPVSVMTTAPAAPPVVPTTAVPPPPPMPTTAVPPPPAPSGPTATDLPPIANPGNAILDVDLPKPDLVPGYMMVSLIDDTEILVGFVVHNNGSADAGSFSVEICNRAGCATASGVPIPAGGSMGSGVTLPVDATHVTGRLVFTVDTGNAITESNEGNNVSEQNY